MSIIGDLRNASQYRRLPKQFNAQDCPNLRLPYRGQNLIHISPKASDKKSRWVQCLLQTNCQGNLRVVSLINR